MISTFDDELLRIAQAVRGIIQDPSLRPNLAPPELLTAALAYPQAGGKALRPALLTWTCKALGGPVDAALRAGVAVELYHTYTLVHDDVIDRDMKRRGKPSVHALMARSGDEQFHLDGEGAAHYGLSMAILTGDVQQAWAIDLLASLPELGVSPEVTLQLIRRFEGIVGPAIVEGEVLDIQLPFLPIEQVTSDMINRVILTKTAALFAFCAWAGGLIARGQEDEYVWALSAFAERAGIAFQLQDDVLGIIGDEKKLGKPVGSDLREGKRTLIITHAWERANDNERALLTSVLGNSQASVESVAEVTALLTRLGAIDEVQEMANAYLDQALDHLHRLPGNDSVQLLREMALKMVKREK
ncbi:MAG TPA: polyprenyl synthetase family protein [Armatimonadota bacterium]|nr:polyprenyl synthetase family protein [Armatimonadota bacterium]